ncbi:2-oxo acid dehydrogenase subunit E2 [Sphingorhabdus soli]|uniref:Dihydrolipoamide acetyltransferase component of pyruvate dehydrogenase complex n=1 Tax=Flavisphingopyxis soli TaxID=2601267 RepID=A0A5C6UBE0_9SPHN|nr:dihydrolipoamide acetyltransferase family protein [Sphingorhabdus soli]TXC69235.1 2-oxo acid dehydrogenase subunit E2 [Sphingorhabdus soli]
MAKFTFNLPDIGEGIAEAEIVAWHVKLGDTVEEDAPIADMMTDKATVEMEAPVSGKIVAVAGEEGDVIAIGSMLVEIEVAGEVPDDVLEANEAAAQASAQGEADVVDATDAGPGMDDTRVAAETPGVGDESPSPLQGRGSETYRGEAEISRSGEGASEAPSQPLSPTLSPGGERGLKVLASPAVRARAKDLGVDLADVKPAADGRIRHADLDAFLSYNGGQGYRAAGASATRDDETIKVIGMRRRIADNMSASKRSIPHFTYVEEIDVTDLETMRGDLNANRGSKPKLTLLPLIITAICKAIPDFPMINARYDDEAGIVTRSGAIHLGMATQTDAGLMVPVIRDAQDRNVWQLASEIGRLADAARSGKAKSTELSGSTLTITSLGPLGGVATTPVINKPEVAIIGPNRIVERPMFTANGDIEARKLMNLSISCDHRVVDGWDAASFVQALRKYLETPVLLFAD